MAAAAEVTISLTETQLTSLAHVARRAGAVAAVEVVEKLSEAWRQADAADDTDDGGWVYIHPKTGKASPCIVVARDVHVRGAGSRDRRSDRAWIRTRGRDTIVEMRSLVRESELSDRRGWEELELPL